jgi:hypothetical protein
MIIRLNNKNYENTQTYSDKAEGNYKWHIFVAGYGTTSVKAADMRVSLKYLNQR